MQSIASKGCGKRKCKGNMCNHPTLSLQKLILFVYFMCCNNYSFIFKDYMNSFVLPQ